MKKIEILGYYKRIRDDSEYILYMENGTRNLTNGVFIWRDQVKFVERHLPELEEVEQIDMEKMCARLKQSHPYSGIADWVEKHKS